MRYATTVMLLAALLAQPLLGALTFGAATTDRVPVTGTASINDLTTFTVVQWVRPTTLTNNRRWWSKGTTGQKRLTINTGSTLASTITRATVSAEAITSTTVSTGTWYLWAFTYSEADGPRQYIGTISTAMAEAAYTTRTVGSGATSTESSGDLNIGNRTGSSLAFQGDISFSAYYDVILTTAEMDILRTHTHPNSLPSLLGNTKLFMHLGLAGSGTAVQPDWSGNGNNSGTPSGTTLAAHPAVPYFVPGVLSAWFNRLRFAVGD